MSAFYSQIEPPNVREIRLMDDRLSVATWCPMENDVFEFFIRVTSTGRTQKDDQGVSIFAYDKFTQELKEMSFTDAQFHFLIQAFADFKKPSWARKRDLAREASRDRSSLDVLAKGGD